MTANKLFVAGKRLNQKKMVWEYYVKSRSAEDYRDMLMGSLYHPPKIEIDLEKTKENALYLVHRFEGKPLYADYIPNTMLGIEYLLGGTGPTGNHGGRSHAQGGRFASHSGLPGDTLQPKEIKWKRVVYTMKDRKLSKNKL